MAIKGPSREIPPKIRQRLQDCVTTSPVTIVVGPTGCGKSTQVPPFLLDNVGGPVLCTQPRRLAVVAVASRVAQERGVPLGGLEVGYHVGQANHSLANTKLVFTTAGILLEELRANGVKALTKYKVVILDECHERSPEQELCLAMCKLFLQKQKRQSDIRLVLMSATFDHARYKNYFSGLDVPIDTITLETANMVDSMHERVETLYLEDITKLIRDTTNTFQHSRFLQAMRMDPDAELKGEDGGKSLSLDLLNYLRSLVLQVDEEEPIYGVFLIFAPTYRHLQQIFNMLNAIQDLGTNNTHYWQVGVLHSSMDIEDCIETMQPRSNGGKQHRKILLASAIADSSVTIPGVSCVIDLCRALQVHWNPTQASHVAKTTWASQSICDQRRGRTGRTCPGRCFRLVSKGFFVGRLEPFDEPLLAMSSCRNEVLKLLCCAAAANSSTDAVKVMNLTLDPPPKDVVTDAFRYLQSIGACVVGKKGTFVPTKMGDLLAALPLTVEDSQIVVAGAQLGLLHETLALRAMMSHKPAPIVHHFGDTAVNDANILCYFDQAPVGTQESLLMANLSAYLYWDVTWNRARGRAATEHFAYSTGSSTHVSPQSADFMSTEVDATKPCCNVWRWCPTLDEKHSQWCRARGINPTSVRGVAELIDTALNVFYLAGMEPQWLKNTDPTPLWRRFHEWKGMQLNDYINTRDVLSMVYDFPTGAHRLSKTLMALSTDSTQAVSEMTKNKDYMLDIFSLSSNKPVRTVQQAPPPSKVACMHFLSAKGCSFGDNCRNSHSPYAVRPVCKFMTSTDGCKRGDKCMFSHEEPKENPIAVQKKVQVDPLSSLAPCIPSLSLPHDIIDWFEKHHRALLLLGDGNFDFTRSLASLGVAPRFATDLNADTKSLGYTDIFGLDATRMHVTDAIVDLIRGLKVATILWNFPFTDDEADEANGSLMLGTFHSLLEVLRKAVQPGGNPLAITFAVALQGDQFSRWNVNRSAMRTGWRLSKWGEFDLQAFPGYKPRRANGEAFPACSARLYEFKIHTNQLTTL